MSPLAALDDDELAAELRSLGSWLDFPSIAAVGAVAAVAAPTGATDPARIARLRLESTTRRRGWRLFGGRPARPLRRSFVLAIVAVIVVAAIAGAIGFGVPGIRIIFRGATPLPSITLAPSPAASPSTTTTPSPSPSPTAPGLLGSDLDLGIPTTLTEASTLSGWSVLLPTDPAVGPPDAVWYRDGRVTLLWKSRAALPDTTAAGVGLLMTEFRGTFDREFFQKIVGPDTVVTPASVGGSTGYWIAGEVHDFFYVDPTGEIVNDSRRVVGDTLIWTDGEITLRLESSLGKDEAIRIATSMR
jgi:hypothetical protein